MIDVPQAIKAAREHHEAGRLPEAETIYQQILQLEPGHADALHLVGVIAHQEGRNEIAIDFLSKAIAVDSSVAIYHSNLGSAYRALKRFDEAIVSYKQALTIKPDYADAHYNLGVTLYDQGSMTNAIICFKKSIALKPHFALAHYNLGMALRSRDKIDEAIKSFREVIKMEPENEVVHYLIATLTGKNYDRAPDQYIASLFDGCADYFDQLLVHALKYDTPERLVETILQLSSPPAKRWDALDLGCGTGLVGLAIAPYTRQLVGVDLAGNMLEKSKSRNVYQRLEQSDLLSMMEREAAASFDVIIAADVFVYIGKLDEIISQAKRLLRPGGFIAFSVEALDALSQVEIGPEVGRTYRLSSSGRYAHAAAYLTQLASVNDFKIRKTFGARTRLQDGKPVQAWLSVWEN
ncbi:MAG: tetratricopeptide repeat protein [Pseudomonadota bacterium]